MTPHTTAPTPSGIITLYSRWSDLRRVEQVSYLVATVLVGSGLFHLGVFAIVGGPWDGPVSWRKPATFGLSFGLTLAAICWVSSCLTFSPRAGAWVLGVFAADCVLEVSGITLQAWRRVPSHFNNETPFDTVVAMSLAVGGAVLIATLGTLAVIALRRPVQASKEMQFALRAGLVLLMIGLATGVAMIVSGTTLIKTGHRQSAYNTAGSLKWAHGVTLHAILVLPSLALGLVSLGWTEHRRAGAVVAATGVYAAATLAVFAAALL